LNKNMANQITSCIPQTECKTVDLDHASISAYQEPHTKRGDGSITFEFTDGKVCSWKYTKEQRNEFLFDMAMIQAHDKA
jgi:hypothetical protein